MFFTTETLRAQRSTEWVYLKLILLPLPFHPYLPLVEYYFTVSTGFIFNKIKGCLHDLQKEFRFAFRKDLNFTLTGSLGKYPVALNGNCQYKTRHQFIITCISRKYFR